MLKVLIFLCIIDAASSAQVYHQQTGISSLASGRRYGVFGRGGLFGKTIKYADSNNEPIEYSFGTPVYTSRHSFLYINDHRYYWWISSYRPDPDRPIKCEERFNQYENIFEDVYLLDDFLTIFRGNRSRPDTTYFDCEEGYYCCKVECCNSYRTFYIIGIILLILMVLFFLFASKEICRSFLSVHNNQPATPSPIPMTQVPKIVNAQSYQAIPTVDTVDSVDAAVTPPQTLLAPD